MRKINIKQWKDEMYLGDIETLLEEWKEGGLLTERLVEEVKYYIEKMNSEEMKRKAMAMITRAFGDRIIESANKIGLYLDEIKRKVNDSINEIIGDDDEERALQSMYDEWDQQRDIL